MRIGCIVLAAGNASRFGSNKLHAQVDGSSLICRALSAVPTGLDTVVVSRYPEILEQAAEAGCAGIYNDSPECGVSRSIRLGLAHLADCRGVLLMMADQPWLKRESVEALVALWAQNPERMAALAHGGACGMPCVFPARVFPQLMELTGEADGMALLQSQRDAVLLLETDAWELADVNTPESLARGERAENNGAERGMVRHEK